MDNITVLILTNGVNLITQFDRLSSQLGEPDIKLTKPYIITIGSCSKLLTESLDNVKVNMKCIPWLSELTDDKVVIIHSDKVLTSLEPCDDLLKMYKKAIEVE